MANDFEFIRHVANKSRTGSTLEAVLDHWKSGKETFLFISPHDDDVVVGGGLMIQLAIREKADVHIMTVTDGAMGYCSMDQKDTISDIRRDETFECYEALGVPKENITWLGFPDCQLNSYRGRRPAEPNDVATIEGFVGLQNTLTYYLRKVRPTRCFLPTSNDLHPDHKIVHSEFLISIYHALGDIWPELGTPIETAPEIYELGVYCDFPEPPQLCVRTSEAMLDKKLNGMLAFRSQKQMKLVMGNFKRAGAEEYLRQLEFKLYQPAHYRPLFDKE